ncbi:MAG: transcription-repair coupling factor [Actinomycetes bacterium]
MSLSPLLGSLTQDPAVAEAVRLARTDAVTEHSLTAPGAARPFVIAALADSRQGAGRPVLAVVATGRESEDLVTALRSLLPAESVVEFPAWETLPHERLSPGVDTVGRRTAVLRRLRHPGDAHDEEGVIRVVVAPVRALLQPIVSGIGDVEPVILRQGDQVVLDDAVRTLSERGYARVDLVDRRGQFAVRGGILDVFVPTEEHPQRVEFWGDEVDEVRWFAVADQRSLGESPEGVWATPCRELLLTDAVRARAAALAPERDDLADLLSRIAEGMHVEGMEALAPVLADGLDLLTDAVDSRSIVVVCDPERIRTRAHELVATSQEFLEASWHNAAVGNSTPVDLGRSAYRDLSEVREAAQSVGLSWWSVSPFGLDDPLGVDDSELDAPTGSATAMAARPVPQYLGDVQAGLRDAAALMADGYSVVLVAEGAGAAQRIAEECGELDIPARTEIPLEAIPEPGVVAVTTATVEHGFIADRAHLVLMTESDLAGQRTSTKDMRRMPARRRRTIDPLTLAAGDYIVHEHHGVGRYIEMVQRTVGGATREYVVIEYAPSKRGQPGDRVYVPTDQLDLVTRYVGGEAPTLHRLGGADWQKAKGRARKAVRQIAAELVRLYAARMSSPGFAFSPDTPWQRELEDAFPYVETPDQAASIDEVKADMEKSIPMDRVIAGDVGYGKTEIAVRAAFKAVQDGKQVAVLVPTTLLVQQHYATFSERYAGFPVKVAALSRFQSTREAAAVLEGVSDGTVDVVIGTHRLLSADVRFKDLGLAIVDEEQRFGVEHKEHLKALRTDVDMLTMSATPIPRTLEMSITGIREMSLIQTPPEERHPVLTFVGPFDDRQVSAAIRRELMREGQVFYVHNRVDSIDRTATKLAALIPEARIAVAHGQMGEGALEQVIVDFWEKRFDVLVCTTIVESGLDIANANTLILDRADVFGLSQLHQLRGRVGRGRERAYAYFLYPADRPLSEMAHDRLSTIAQHTDLGSGMAVAMKDLEIRGAGNLLGGEQSGHIADVGFDLYVRLVGEALQEFTGGTTAELTEMTVELPVDAHIPHDYIPSERLRLEAYRRIADAVDDAALDAVAEELVDRYGALPEAVATLFEVARFRVLARAAGLADVVAAGPHIRLHPVELAESRQLRLTRLYPGTLIKPATRTILVPRPTTARVGGTPLVDRELLTWARDLVANVLTDQPASAPAS